MICMKIRREIAFLAGVFALFALCGTLVAPQEAFAADSITIWRLYNMSSGEHLFTTSANEYKKLSSKGWRQEGAAWEAPSSSSTPVYRLYNPSNGDHHYTTSHHEYTTLSSSGWRGENVGFYSAGTNEKPIYRLFNPNESTGTHHYTKYINEYAKLGSAGWQEERVGWYGVGTPDPLPKDWVIMTGLFRKMNLYDYAKEKGMTDKYKLEILRKSYWPIGVLEFGEEKSYYTVHWRGADQVYSLLKWDHIQLDPDLFEKYPSGQQMTLAVNQRANFMPGDWYKTFGPTAGEVAIL